MSAPQMAQEFAGLVERKSLPVPAKTKVSGVNLFLPAQVFLLFPFEIAVSFPRADIETLLLLL